MIKSHSQAVLVQSLFRHVLVSSSIKIVIEFSLVGILGRRERVIGSNHTVGGSSREPATASPRTTQICDISSDHPPKCTKLFELLVQVERNGRFARHEQSPGTAGDGLERTSTWPRRRGGDCAATRGRTRPARLWRFSDRARFVTRQNAATV